MIAYYVKQIQLGRLTYLTVITKKPELQEAMDTYIADNNLDIDKTI